MIGENHRLFGPQINLMPFDYGLDFAGARGTTHNLSAGPVDDLSINVYDRLKDYALCPGRRQSRDRNQTA